MTRLSRPMPERSRRNGRAHRDFGENARRAGRENKSRLASPMASSRRAARETGSTDDAWERHGLFRCGRRLAAHSTKVTKKAIEADCQGPLAMSTHFLIVNFLVGESDVPWASKCRYLSDRSAAHWIWTGCGSMVWFLDVYTQFSTARGDQCQ
jgi:hypothetical protein